MENVNQNDLERLRKIFALIGELESKEACASVSSFTLDRGLSLEAQKDDGLGGSALPVLLLVAKSARSELPENVREEFPSRAPQAIFVPRD